MNHPRSTTPAGDPNPTNNPLLAPSNPLVSDLEQEVLDEYTRLLRNVNKVWFFSPIGIYMLFCTTGAAGSTVLLAPP
jgi:hypothetical protein